MKKLTFIFPVTQKGLVSEQVEITAQGPKEILRALEKAWSGKRGCKKVVKGGILKP